MLSGYEYFKNIPILLYLEQFLDHQYFEKRRFLPLQIIQLVLLTTQY